MTRQGWAARWEWGSRSCLVGLIFLLPLFVLPGLNDAWDQSKIALTASLTFLALLCWVVGRLLAGSVTLRWSLALMLFTFFFAWAVFSSVINASGYAGWIGLHGQYASSILGIGVVTMLLWTWVQVMDARWNATAIRALIVSLTIGVVLSAIIALAQIYAWAWLSELTNPLADDQLQLGMLMLLALLLLVHRWMTETSRRRWWPLVFALLALLLLIGFDLTAVWAAMVLTMTAWLGTIWKRAALFQKIFVMSLGLIAVAGLGLPIQSWLFGNTYDPLPHLRLGRVVSVDLPLRSMVFGEGPQAAVVSFSRTMLTAQDEVAPAFALFPEGQRVLSFSSHWLDLYFGIGLVGVLLLGVAMLAGLGAGSVETKGSWEPYVLRKIFIVAMLLGMVVAPLSFLLFALLALGFVVVPAEHAKNWQLDATTGGRTAGIVIVAGLCALGVAGTVLGVRMVRAIAIATQAQSDIASQAQPLEEVEQRFVASHRLDPANPEYPIDQGENLVVQGELLSRSGQQDLAESKFASAIALMNTVMHGPNDLVLLDRAYRIHATVARVSDQFGEEFRAFLFLAQQREPSSPLWFERLGELDLALFQLPKYSRPEFIAEAMSAYRQAQQLNPNRIEPVLGESKTKEAQGELSASIALLDEALRLRQDDQRLLLELGRLYRLTGKADAAIAAFERVNQIYGDQATALLHLEQLYEAKGDMEQQKNLLTRLLMLEPEDQTAKAKLDRLSSEE